MPKPKRLYAIASACAVRDVLSYAFANWQTGSFEVTVAGQLVYSRNGGDGSGACVPEHPKALTQFCSSVRAAYPIPPTPACERLAHGIR
jgi:hypothetical protein